jgi:hypothetical protein
MPTGDPTDVTSTLTDLERKLVELERELGTVAAAPSAATSPLPVTPTPTETREASLRVEDLRGEIADLVRFRDQLESAARELVSEYDRLVARIQGAPAPPPAPSAPVAAPSAPAAPAAPVAATPAPAPAPAPPAPAAAGAVDEELPFEGQVTVDAGPFRDITTLQSFEQALARVDGAQDVYVRAFEGDRAHIDVRLSNQVPLVRLLREQLSLPIIAREAGEGRLSIDVTADSHGT